LKKKYKKRLNIEEKLFELRKELEMEKNLRKKQEILLEKKEIEITKFSKIATNKERRKVQNCDDSLAEQLQECDDLRADSEDDNDGDIWKDKYASIEKQSLQLQKEVKNIKKDNEFLNNQIIFVKEEKINFKEKLKKISINSKKKKKNIKNSIPNLIWKSKLKNNYY